MTYPTHTINLRQLTDSERLDAQDTARAIVARKIGDKPTYEQFEQRKPHQPERADYADHTVSRYPKRVTWLVGLLMAVVFIASAMPSLFRLFSVGRDYFSEGIVGEPVQASIVGLATFLLAEFLVILSTLSARVFFSGKAQLVFAIPVVGGLAVATVGNWTVTQPHDLFGWLETIVPVGAVLFTALVGERIILESIRAGYQNEQAYKQALGNYQSQVSELNQRQQNLYERAVDDWQYQVDHLEQHGSWQPAYANALKDTLIQSNGRGRGASDRREFMASLNGADWKPYILRELNADKWIDNLFTEPLELTPEKPVAQFNGNIGVTISESTKRLEMSAKEDEDTQPVNVEFNGNGNKRVTKTCAICGDKFRTRNADKAYCSDECKRKAQNERAKTI